MNSSLRLRPALMQDADLLLAWRNDTAARLASHHIAEVERDGHLAWLRRMLANPGVRLLIAEEEGVPVGTVRAELLAGVWLLSWTTAPAARGRGIGRRMVALMVRQLAGPVRAEVKAGNAASARIAEHAGLHCLREVDGVRHYWRDGSA